MKKSKVFITAGSLILAIAAVLATKANKKFTPVTTGVTAGIRFHAPIGGGTNLFTVGGGTQIGMKIYTTGGNLANGALKTSGVNATPVKYNHNF